MRRALLVSAGGVAGLNLGSAVIDIWIRHSWLAVINLSVSVLLCIFIWLLRPRPPASF